MPKEIDILRLEGMIINGLIKEYSLIDCKRENKVRMSKIVAISTNEEEYETPCYEYPRISRVYVLASKYKDLLKMPET
ncbi:MAG: hypothetical protein QN229_02830 [Desulfurococcaceae archaeon TW002]